MKYDENEVEKLYQENLSAARQLLASLPVAEGREPTTKGLNGWVYEQTIRHCLSQELIALGIFPIIKEQVPLYGRTKIDLLVGRVAVEIKALGSFGDDARKYSKYRTKVEEKGWVYCYLTRSETYQPLSLGNGSRLWKRTSFLPGYTRRLGKICERSLKELRSKAITNGSTGSPINRLPVSLSVSESLAPQTHLAQEGEYDFNRF